MTRLINNDIMTEKKLYWGRTIASFFLVLFTMPLGHALMRVMEETMETSVMNTCAFIMGAVGLAIAVWGVFVKGDTKQTLFGLFGGLLFWTGWVEFLYGYFAMRFGVHYDLVGSGTVQTITEYVNGIGVSHDMLINGVNVNDIPADVLKEMRGSRPEYLIMPASFGFWVMFIVLYLFGSRTGCHALNWLQKVFFGKKMQEIVPRSMSRHTAITTFMELNIMMWTMYLLLMFVYDPAFLGESHPVTIAIAIGCLVGSIFMFRYELGLHGWGPNIRMAISTVVIFWTTVEVFARNGLLTEFWIDPMNDRGGLRPQRSADRILDRPHESRRRDGEHTRMLRRPRRLPDHPRRPSQESRVGVAIASGTGRLPQERLAAHGRKWVPRKRRDGAKRNLE